MVVGNSTLEGVVTSAVAQLVVKVPVKITVQPKPKLNQPVGAAVNFSAVRGASKQPWVAHGDRATIGVFLPVIERCVSWAGVRKLRPWEYPREMIFITRSPTTWSGRELMATS